MLAGVAGCGAESPGADAPKVTGALRCLYGPIHGKLQTPTGGKPGTTTPGRPTLGEVGVDRASMPDVSAAVDWGRHEVYAGYRFIRLSGDATLDDPLISQGHTFDAGTHVNADVTLDWLRAGYRYRFPIDLNGDGVPDFSLYPAAGLAVWNFDYRLDQPGPDDAHRSYIRPTPQLGLGADVPLTDRLSIVADGLASVPVGHQPQIYSGQLLVRYLLFELSRSTVYADLGVNFDRLEYRSGNQEVPNHVTIDAGPALVAGVVVRF